jgi:hypothetical protein
LRNATSANSCIIWMEMAKSQAAIKAVAFARFSASPAAAETT